MRRELDEECVSGITACGTTPTRRSRIGDPIPDSDEEALEPRVGGEVPRPE